MPEVNYVLKYLAESRLHGTCLAGLVSRYCVLAAVSLWEVKTVLPTSV